MLTGAVGFGLFSAAAFGLTMTSMTPWLNGGAGTGQTLSAEVAAGLVALAFLPRLARSLSAV